MNHKKQIIYRYAAEYFREEVKGGMNKEKAIEALEKELTDAMENEDTEAAVVDEVEKFEKSLEKE